MAMVAGHSTVVTSGQLATMAVQSLAGTGDKCWTTPGANPGYAVCFGVIVGADHTTSDAVVTLTRRSSSLVSGNTVDIATITIPSASDAVGDVFVNYKANLLSGTPPLSSYLINPGEMLVARCTTAAGGGAATNIVFIEFVSFKGVTNELTAQTITKTWNTTSAAGSVKVVVA